MIRSSTLTSGQLSQLGSYAHTDNGEKGCCLPWWLYLTEMAPKSLGEVLQLNGAEEELTAASL